MRSLLKINLNGGLKRLVSTLICLVMVLATFPMHMLINTVSAEEEEEKQPISITLSSANEVNGWKDDALNQEKINNSNGKIKIELTDDITLSDTNNQMASSNHFFDFTDSRFAGKTITIDGGGKTIKIDNAELFFLRVSGCTVILKNIIIDGGWLGLDDEGNVKEGSIIRSASFINVSSGSESKLQIQERTTIQNCRSTGSGGAIYNSGQLEINGGEITGCRADVCGGGVYNSNGGTLTAAKGEITGCAAGKVDEVSQGDAIFNLGTLILPAIPSSDPLPFKTNNTDVNGSNYDGVLNGDKVYQIVLKYNDANNAQLDLDGDHIKYYPVGSDIKIPEREPDEYYTYTCSALKYGASSEVGLSGYEFGLADSMVTGVSSGEKITFEVQYQKSIDITLNSSNVSNMISFMKGLNDDALSSMGGDINITLSGDITLSNTANQMASSNHFFDFTDFRFAGKTITIDGTKNENDCHQITISDAGLSFLKLKNCTVILQNIKIDGGNNSRTQDFIKVEAPDGENSSMLVMNNAKIDGVKGTAEVKDGNENVTTPAINIYVINNAGTLQIASGSILYSTNVTNAINNSGTVTLPEKVPDDQGNLTCPFKINDDDVHIADPKYISNDGAADIIIECSGTGMAPHTEYIGIYPAGALIEVPEIEGYTLSELKDSGGAVINPEVQDGASTGQYKLTSVASGDLPLKAIFAQNRYKLQYKDVGALEETSATVIGDSTNHPNGYTLGELKAVSGGKSKFETLMGTPSNDVTGREFKGWKLGGSSFNLPETPAEGQEKEDVDWDTLLEHAEETTDKGVYTITFQAVWSPQPYIIKYVNDANAAIAVMAGPDSEDVDFDWNDTSYTSIKVHEGDEIPKLVPKNAVSGKTFSGWKYIVSGESTTEYTFSGEADWTSLASAASTASGVKTITFKAVYDAVKYFIKYINEDEDYIGVHFEGGKNDFYSQEVLYGGSNPKVFAPSKKYYQFDHWEYGKDTGNGNNPYTTTDFQIGSDGVTWNKLFTGANAEKVILVKAIYTPIKYTIKYKDGESIVKTEGEKYTTNENSLDSAIPEDTFQDGVKTGYKFNRWMYNNVLGRRRKLILGRTKWRDLLDGVTADNIIVLFADYGPVEYTIKYDTGDGTKVSSGAYTPSDSTAGCRTGDKAAISGTTPTKTGYYFDKWTYGDGGNKTDFTANSTTWEDLAKSATLSADKTTGTITLKANFAPITYTINYETGDGSQVSSDAYTPSDAIGNKISDNATISGTTPTKTGYYFDKWTYGQNNTEFTANSTTWADLVSSATLSEGGKTGTITLKANFAPITYTINYDTDGGDSIDADTYTTDESGKSLSGAAAISGTTPKKTGYCFKNWTYGQNNTNFTANSTTWENLINSATLSEAGKTGTITLKANFEPVTYTIKYTTNSYKTFTDETYTTNEDGKLLSDLVKLNKNPGKSKQSKTFKCWLYGKKGQCMFDSKTTTWEDLVKTAVGDVIYFKASYHS